MEIKVEDKTYVIKKPGQKQLDKAKLLSSKKFREYMNEGLILRDELDQKLLEAGHWDSEKEKELEETKAQIEERVKKIKKGGIELKQAKQLALEVKYLRLALNLLTRKHNELYQHTVESRVDDDYFDCLVSECVFDEEGNKVYESFEDYQERSTELYSVKAANKLAELIYGFDPDWEKQLPENQFLLKYKFMDEELNLVQEDSEEEEVVEEEEESLPFLQDGQPVE